MIVRRLFALVLVVAGVAPIGSVIATPAAAQGMPDIRQMSGTPLPVSDVPVGTVTVRVVRGTMSNVVADHPVQLLGAGQPVTVKTNEAGRAEFSGLTVGTRVRAATEVAGERLESQDFQVPAAGGIRLLLVATDPAGGGREAAPQAPAQPGTVVFGDESRIVVEIGEDGLNVFNILQILNRSAAPVQTAAPIVLHLPDAAQSASMMQGSSPQAVASGKQVTITGPFAPGPTVVQFAYTIPLKGSGDVTIRQTLPIALMQFTVVAQKVGQMQLASPQIARHRDITAEGQQYLLGQGPALEAGDTITLAFTGLPHAPAWPRTVALVLAVLILAAGVWGSARARRGSPETASRDLLARRERLFAELTDLEERHRAGTVDAEAYQSRRRALVAALERIYAEIDQAA